MKMKSTTSIQARLLSSKGKSLVVVFVGTYMFIVRISFTMIASFLPQEAAKFDVAEATVGVIFAVFSFATVLAAVVIGVVLPILGAKRTMQIGLLLEGSCQILFAYVIHLPNRVTFVFFSILIRVVMGFGGGACFCSGLYIIMNVFREDFPLAMGILGTVLASGVMIGPAFAGYLYELGGFGLPFYVTGGTIIMLMFMSGFVLDKDEDAVTIVSEKLIFSLLMKPCIAVTAMLTFVLGGRMVYYNPILGGHLQQFDLSPSQIGLVFLICPAVYSICGPITGYFTRTTNPRVLISVGMMVSGLLTILFGPAPFLSTLIPSKLYLKCIILALMGVFESLSSIPIVPDIMYFARVRYHFPDDLVTTGAVSGIYTAFYNLGGGIGPLLGGYFTETMNFSWAITVLGFIILLMGVVIIIQTAVIGGFSWRRPFILKNPKSLESNMEDTTHLLNGNCFK